MSNYSTDGARMPTYKYSQFLSVSTSSAFDALSEPGTKAVSSGIYRCEVCGREIAANKGDPLPPQNHHQHPAGKGPIRWRLIVFSD